ncbi:MAG: tetratricopeptide repeat protein [Nonlabens sp.]
MRFLLGLLTLLCTTRLVAQDPRLAENYMDQGEYVKALKIYQKVYDKNKRNTNSLFKLVEVYQQLESFETVDSLLSESGKIMPTNKQLLIEQGYNKSLQGKDSIASQFYDKALASIDSLPQYTYQIASRFEKRSLLDQAVLAYEKGQEIRPNPNFSIQLARLYGEQGEVAKMFDSYLDIVEQNEQYRYRAQSVFSQYVTDDPNSEANKLLRKALLTVLRDNPNPIYNKLLSWLFVQQKDFKKAFVQEKAIYRRNPETIGTFMALVNDAVDEQDTDAAIEILDFMIAESQSDYIRYNARAERVKIQAENVLVEEYPAIKAEFENLLHEYGHGNSTYALQLNYADFLAFKNDEVAAAVDLLGDLEKVNLNPIQKARVKMKLADILVLQEQFNRALILYTQVQNDVPNNELAQESQYRVARTSYFQGDFPWSLTQLKVLRGATSKLIANDAMELSLVIADHSIEDTTFVALKAFAKADLLQYQNKRKEAIEAYRLVLENHKGDPIEDEALLKIANLQVLEGNFDIAASNYQAIIDNYGDGILADDAYYLLARLYEDRLVQPEKAKVLYEAIIFNHADSIHLVDARRRFRRLRDAGDI